MTNQVDLGKHMMLLFGKWTWQIYTIVDTIYLPTTTLQLTMLQILLYIKEHLSLEQCVAIN